MFQQLSRTPGWVGGGNMAPGVDKLDLSLVVSSYFSTKSGISSSHCYFLYGHLFVLHVLWLVQ